jgi:hypothetical protein
VDIWDTDGTCYRGLISTGGAGYVNGSCIHAPALLTINSDVSMPANFLYTLNLKGNSGTTGSIFSIIDTATGGHTYGFFAGHAGGGGIGNLSLFNITKSRFALEFSMAGAAVADTLSILPSGGQVNFPSIAVGTGTVLARYARYSKSISPASVAGNTCAAQTFSSITGITSSDILIGISKPTEQAGLSVTPGHVTGTGAASINFCNTTGSAKVPTASETYQFVVVQ